MSRKVKFSKDAKIDLHKAICYFKIYDKDNDFREDFRENVDTIKRFPEGFQIRYNRTRIIKLNKFKYSIHYSLVGDIILIVRITNQALLF